MNEAGVKFRITSDTQAFNKGMREASKGLQNVDKDLKTTEKGVGSFKDAFEELDGLALAGLTAALAAVGKASADVLVDVTKTAVGFDSGMRKVMTLLDENAEASQDWGSAFKQASIETGQSLGDVTEATYQAISAGIDYSDSVDFVTEQNKLAIGGHTDLTSAIDVTTKTLNAYGLGAEDAARINDILIATQNNGITTVNELSSVLSQVTPTAAAMGVSFEQVGASMATLTSQGTPTAQAATQLNSLLAELGKTGTQASDSFKEIAGQSFQEFIASGGTVGQAIQMMTSESGNLKSKIEETANSFPRLKDGSLDYAKAIDQVIESDSGASAGLIDMFGSIEAAKAALQLASGEGKVFSDNLDKMNNSAGATTEAFGDMTEGSPEHAMNQFNSAVEVLKSTLGEQLLPALTPLIEGLGKMVKALSENEVMAKIVVVALLAITLAVTAFGIAVAIMGAQALIASIGINAMLWPILAIIAVIALVIAIIIVFWEQISSVFTWAWELTKTVFEGIGEVISVQWEMIKTATSVFFNFIKIIVTTYWDFVKTVTIALFEALKTIITTAWNVIKTVWDVTLTAIKVVMAAFINGITATVNAFKSLLINIFTTLWNGVKVIFESAKNAIMAIVNALKSSAINAFNSMKTSVVNAVNGLKTGAMNAFNSMKSGISSVINGIVGTLNGFKDRVIGVKNTISSAFQGMVTNVGTGIQSGIASLISSIKSTVNTFAINPLNAAIGVINKLPGVSIGSIPALAKGGIVGAGGKGGSVVLAGEAGKEAVLPLKPRVLSEIGDQILSASGVKMNQQQMLGNKINVNINVPVGANLMEFKQATEEAFRQLSLEGAL